jgi:hypothetical protein
MDNTTIILSSRLLEAKEVSEEIDKLIAEIVELGRRKLNRTSICALLLPEFEGSLRTIRDRLRKDAKERRWKFSLLCVGRKIRLA